MEHTTEHLIKCGKHYFIVKYCAEAKYNRDTNTFDTKISCVDFYPLKKREYIYYIDEIIKKNINRIKYKIKRIRYGYI